MKEVLRYNVRNQRYCSGANKILFMLNINIEMNLSRSLMSAVSFGLHHGTPLSVEVRHFILGSLAR